MSNKYMSRDDGRTKRSLHLRIPPDPIYARTVRDAIIGFGSLHGIDENDIEALLFAVGEALANAIEHSNSQDDIEVIAEVDDRSVTATVVDHGRGLAATPTVPAELPVGLADRGRGIPIMQRCSDIFNVKSTPGKGTAITLGRWRKQYENAEPQSAS